LRAYPASTTRSGAIQIRYLGKTHHTIESHERVIKAAKTTFKLNLRMRLSYAFTQLSLGSFSSVADPMDFTYRLL
jgi:hypothetical protein